MGCDVHWMCERIETHWKTKEEKWVNCDHFKLNRDYDPEDTDDRYFSKKYEVVPVANDRRNYDLFAVLADVRNYNGIITPISPPKGIPEDVSPVIREEIEYWDSDGHSHSYLTLKELKDYQKENFVKLHKGYLTDEQAKLFDELGEEPEIYHFNNFYHARNYREWTAPDETLSDLIDSLEKRKREEFSYNNPDEDVDEKIRIVFWFDN
jgi:hypothetical protein